MAAVYNGVRSKPLLLLQQLSDEVLGFISDVIKLWVKLPGCSGDERERLGVRASLERRLSAQAARET